MTYARNRRWRQKHRESHNLSRKRYYAKAAAYVGNGRSRWTAQHDALVLAHDRPDKELAQALRRSLKAIQVRRCRLKARHRFGTNLALPANG